MRYEDDQATGPPWMEEELPFRRDKILYAADSHINLSLDEFEKSGIAIMFTFGKTVGQYNDEPYKDRATAEREYAKVSRAVKDGHFYVELQQNGEFKLKLTEK